MSETPEGLQKTLTPLIFDFCNFCHKPVFQTVSNADLKSTKVQNNFLPNKKYIVTNEYSTNTLSVVENRLQFQPVIRK
jgi:hypothetical protein